MNVTLERFTGGQRAFALAAATGAAGLLLTLAGGFFGDARRALFAYLTAFVYWVGVAVAALILLSAFHAAKARWVVVLRRPLEWMGSSSLAFVLLFLPIALGMRQLFPWVEPDAGLGEEALHLLAHKRLYLNVPGFLVRAVLYFAVWVGVSHLLWRWSTRQDEEGGVALLHRQRLLGTGALPFLGLTITFAAFDWMMSLAPLWQSTIFGVYYFAGSFLAAIALLTLVTALARGKDLPGSLVTSAHLHNLGKLLLAFVAFWAYIAFSQYLLVWIANLPEENPYYVLRTRTAWQGVFLFLVAGHFLLPFFVLLSRQLKQRPLPLALAAVWMLAVHFVDIYWLVMPVLLPDAPAPHWTDLTALAGVGGAAIAVTLLRAKGQYAVPVKDPYLNESLRYVQP